jgi:hypothetical protein
MKHQGNNKLIIKVLIVGLVIALMSFSHNHKG